MMFIREKSKVEHNVSIFMFEETQYENLWREQMDKIRVTVTHNRKRYPVQFWKRYVHYGTPEQSYIHCIGYKGEVFSGVEFADAVGRFRKYIDEHEI